MNVLEVKPQTQERPEKYPLSPEQEKIVYASANLPQLVIAPPGAGKTHIVVGRILHLIQEEGLSPNEMLVLCFTRTAVAEISHRLKNLVRDQHAHDDLRFLTIRTFDSFATRLLFAIKPDLDLSGYDYDSRIKVATEALGHENNEASQIVLGFKHLIVDEIQDVVGVRAELVKLLLQRISGSFTLLGDPAQAIYKFSMEENEASQAGDTLLEWVMKQKWFDGAVMELTENHRSKGVVAERTRAIRNYVISGNDDDPAALKNLRKFVEELPQAGSGREPSLPDTAPGETLCVLCRSNGEVLLFASMFQLKGIPHSVKPRPEDKGLPAWIGRIFGTYPNTRISSREFEDRWHTLVGNTIGMEPGQAWDWLKRIEDRDQSDMDLRTLVSQLSHGKSLPDDLDAHIQKDQIGIAISTIHAVKGREFDHVIVLQPDTERGQENTKEEARVLYVAATRAKKELSSIGRDGIPRMWKAQCGDNRKRWVSKAADYYFMEIGLNNDVEQGSAVSSYVQPDPRAAATVQDMLWNELIPGDQVAIGKIINGRYAFFYIVTQTQKPTIVGQMSIGFKNNMRYIQRGISHIQETAFPEYMNNIPVTAVVTEILPAYSKNTHEPYATSRFALGLRIRGMGYIYKD